MDSDMARRVVDRCVIVPHNRHWLKNGWLKYDHRIMYKKYTAPCPIYGMGVVERHLEMAQPTKKTFAYKIRYYINFIKMVTDDIFEPLVLCYETKWPK